MKVELSDEAEAQAKRIDTWWRENRLAATDLFTNELNQALLALEDTPDWGRATSRDRRFVAYC